MHQIGKETYHVTDIENDSLLKQALRIIVPLIQQKILTYAKYAVNCVMMK